MSHATAFNHQEAALIERARGGDRGAFREIVGIYEGQVVRLAYSVLGNLDDAREVSQDAFVRVYRSLASFKSQSRFSTWLYRITVNLCKDFLRKKKPRRFLQPWNPGVEEESDEISVIDREPSKDRGPLNHMIQSETEHLIITSMETLPGQQRSVFAMRYLQGMSLEEISSVLGLSVGAVKAHLWHAGQKMRKSLGQHFPEWGGVK